jgi:tRNA dimethylallyltransferase
VPSDLTCLAITGPTASGKTEIALALAEEYPIEIISMDSAMVYRGMDIGTAKPVPAIRQRVPHHLIDILDPEQSYSAGRFAHEAAHLIESISAAGRIALIVGGTMLYLRALREGIAQLPGRDSAIRARIDAEAAATSWPDLHARLAEVDPVTAGRIKPTDRQRIQRALEVYEVTGRSLSALHGEAMRPGMAVDTIALIPEDRQILAQSISDRFAQMIRGGFVDEVRRLHARPGLTADCSSMRAVGYRQIWAYVAGHNDLATATGHAIIATRQLAKRQLTWLRRDERSTKIAAGDKGLPRLLKERIEALLVA